MNALFADANSSQDKIKEKLTALRDAKKKARTAYDAAQEDIKKVLSVRQEAMLVSLGYLD